MPDDVAGPVIKRRGFTLMESLITLWMMGVMLLLVSGLAKDIRQETVNNHDNDLRISAHQALDRMGQAVRSCYAMDEPAAGSSTRLRLKSWNPLQNRPRLPLPPALTGSWTYNSPTFLMNRTFEASGGILLCTNAQGAVTESVRLMGEVAAFRVSRLAQDCRLELEWVDSRGRTRKLVRLCSVGPP